MKRSNRLVLLIGILLAVVAFVGIVLLSSTNSIGNGGPTPPPTSLPTVVAKVAIPLGTPVTADMLDVVDKPTTGRDPTAFSDKTLVIGKVIRRDVVAGTQLVASDFATTGGVANLVVPQGQRAISVQVDQISGVGTVIQAGDYVDVVLGLTGDKFPVVTVNPTDQSIQTVAGLNATSTKVLLQGIQVLGTLLPTPTTTTTQQQNAPAASPGTQQSTTLNGQQEIVILSVTAQQAEVIKYAQLDGSITLALRSPKDFHDATGKLVIPPPDQTTGITLKVLVDQYKVLTPELVEAILPARTR